VRQVVAAAIVAGWIVWCLCQLQWAEDARHGVPTYELPAMVIEAGPAIGSTCVCVP
jgi:hypothetical protein